MFKTLAFAAGLATTNALFYSNNTESQLFMWSEYKQAFGKTYDAVEDSKRFAHFVDNLIMIDARNAMDANKVHGLTKFSDMSQEEFQNTMLGAKVSLKTKNPNTVENIVYSGTSSSKDWAGIYTTPVKDQGYCGSCWAFSATEQLESDAWRVFGTEYILSPEQTTQCTKAAFGCGGGWTESAYSYIQSVNGLETNADYPYTSYQGVTGTCSAVASKEVVGLSGFTTIGGSTSSAVETNMANYVLATGPLSVCLDANNWNSYRGGIMTTCGQQVDHCVQAVGVDTSSTNGYWKVRNSWGTSWGESGYIRLAYGANTCDITNDPTYVAPRKA